jgi:ATP/maltotriose-dependent transcriptional regulator MalT
MLQADTLDEGREALGQGRWKDAKAIFESSLEKGLSPEALDGLGLALWWLREISPGMNARAHAYTEFRRQNRNEEAAVIAAWLAREFRSLFGNDAASDGWLARAERAAESLERSRAEGWILIARAEGERDIQEVAEIVGRAVGIARDHQDVDLEITSLSRLGVIEIGVGDVDSGLRRLDEAMTAATAGEGRDPQSIGEAYCSLMEATDLLGSADRIEKWSAAFDQYRKDYNYLPLMAFGPSHDKTLSSFCGACCGGIYLITGRLDQAESELVSAIAQLERTEMRSRCVHPVTQLAELRVLQGRLEEARTLLSSYEDLPESTRPLAILDLALGSAELAVSRLRSRIEELADLPVLAFPLWSVLVDAEIDRGDLDSAEAAAQDVSRAASITGSSRHEGEALLARGKVEAARKDPNAVASLRDAAKLLSENTLGLLSCRARMELAEALVDVDKPLAISEARAALAAFERMGANADADRASSWLRDLGVKGRTGPKDIGRLSKREIEVLRLLAQGCSNAEIAERLFISVKTAGHHVSNILSKLGVRSRTEAAAYAVLNLGREPAAK